MALKRKEDPPKGSPAWMNTFSDLMNLLLCFFVLLYSMSSVDEEKFQQVIASLQSTISILPSGGASIGDGEMISAGVRQLEFLDSYYNEKANSAAVDSDESTEGTNSIYEQYQEEALAESEEMAEEIEEMIKNTTLEDVVDIDFNAEYVQLSLSGAILFDSGKADIVADAIPIVSKVGRILENYSDNLIEVEGHTDNVPISSSKYENNDVLSMYRALSVATYFRENTTIEASHIKSSGRGEYDPVADNSTEEGRALNRRVEIKIYNSYSSDLGD